MCSYVSHKRRWFYQLIIVALLPACAVGSSSPMNDQNINADSQHMKIIEIAKTAKDTSEYILQLKNIDEGYVYTELLTNGPDRNILQVYLGEDLQNGEQAENEPSIDCMKIHSDMLQQWKEEKGEIPEAEEAYKNEDYIAMLKKHMKEGGAEMDGFSGNPNTFGEEYTAWYNKYCNRSKRFGGIETVIQELQLSKDGKPLERESQMTEEITAHLEYDGEIVTVRKKDSYQNNETTSFEIPEKTYDILQLHMLIKQLPLEEDLHKTVRFFDVAYSNTTSFSSEWEMDEEETLDQSTPQDLKTNQQIELDPTVYLIKFRVNKALEVPDAFAQASNGQKVWAVEVQTNKPIFSNLILSYNDPGNFENDQYKKVVTYILSTEGDILGIMSHLDRPVMVRI